MPRVGYYEEVKRRISEQQPDLGRLLTYGEIAQLYGERFQALGLRFGNSSETQSTLRALTSRRILHRYEQGGSIKIPANEVETLLDVLEEPRPVA